MPSPDQELSLLPSSNRYGAALRQISDSLSPKNFALLRAHYWSPEHSATASELARAAGYEDFRAVNLQYGRIGILLRDALNFVSEGQESYVIASFVPPNARANPEWLWVMHAELAQALRALGWVGNEGVSLTEEIRDDVRLIEGATVQITVNAYERNPEARRLCL